MTVYRVFQKDRRGMGVAAAGERAFVADRFSWSATFLTPLWALGHGLWLELILWIGGFVVLCLSSVLIGGEAVFWLFVLISVLIGFEAAGIRSASLSRRGWIPAGDFIAASEDMAEMGWLARNLNA